MNTSVKNPVKIVKQSRLMVIILLVILVASCSDEVNHEALENREGASLHTELGGDAQGYQRACNTREFNFPADHAAHPGFRNEWWYVTGNLQSSKGTRFGFHATFFRVANKPADSSVLLSSDKTVSSNWVTDEFYMAHFAITQEGASHVRAHERFARAAAGLAGAVVMEPSLNETSVSKNVVNKDVVNRDGVSVPTVAENAVSVAADNAAVVSGADPVVKVWLDDWQLLANEENGQLLWRIKIQEGNDALDLTLQAHKPVVLQGNKGYSQKSANPCNSSYYYSLSRLQSTGKVLVNGQSYDVSGSAWLDREWSSSALADDQVGWDWFALQMHDGRDIMFYRLRQQDGSVDPYSYAAEIDSEGKKTILSSKHLKLNIDRWWQSGSGARYPISGSIHRSDTDETIVFRPLIDDQELKLTVRYWEGAIMLTDGNGRSTGRGYLELTGY